MWLGGGILGRLLPTALMAVGVTFLAAGLLSYAPSTLGDPRPPATPSLPSVPSFSPGSALPSRSPSTTPTAASAASATRIRIASLGIDLPVVPGDLVVPGNEELYPLCDVAMYLPEFVSPGQPGTTYIYAHAQRGMFLPLLSASEVADGASMIGTLVEVYTADAQMHLYEIERVKRHATDLSIAETPPGIHQLVLQTSEGPSGTIPKLQIAARSLSVAAVDPAEALPSPAPRVCLPD